MYVMADGFARLLAPILPVTAEQLWIHLPSGEAREESIHLALFPPNEEVSALIDSALLTRWNRLLEIRSAVNSALEGLRQSKQIGNSLEARVTVTATGEDLALVERYRAQLPMLLIVSEVSIVDGEFAIAVDRARGVKCERCWRYVPNVSADPERQGICDRCQDALAAPVSQ
jgi:isoleucyl-tRNA synthetase